jgi:long-chain acyl-CoA synthetase
MTTYDQKPWLKFYDPDVSREIELPGISLTDLLVRTCQDFPDRIALYFMGMPMTFGELFDKAGRFAKGLQENGLTKGDVVSVCLPNVPQYLVAVLGTLRAGCALSGLAPLFSPDEMAYQLNDCRARVLIVMDSLFEAKIKPVAERIPSVDLVLVTGAADMLRTGGGFPSGTPLEGKQVSSFVEFVNRYTEVPESCVLLSQDACYLQYTGGTTGPPKGAILTHGNMVADISIFGHWMKFERGQEVWLSAFPLFHMAGLMLSTLPLVFGGSQVLIPDPRDLGKVIGFFDKHGPSIVGNVPSLTMMLLADERFRELDFSGLKYWISGAAPFPVEAIKTIEGIIGDGKVVEVWGMTETSPIITSNPARGMKKVGSVGLPLPNMDLRVVAVEDGDSPVPLGEEGELICSGPIVMKAYLNKPQETETALRVHDGKIWMHTGDVGRMDEDGFVYVVDRLKDMINVSGFKVFSSEVESKFYEHPAVGMCALIGVPDPNRLGSEIVKLLVQKSPEYIDKPDAEVENDIIAFARQKMAAFKVPKIVQFVDALPMTSVGKVDKKAMRKASAK